MRVDKHKWKITNRLITNAYIYMHPSLSHGKYSKTMLFVKIIFTFRFNLEFKNACYRFEKHYVGSLFLKT